MICPRCETLTSIHPPILRYDKVLRVSQGFTGGNDWCQRTAVHVFLLLVSFFQRHPRMERMERMERKRYLPV